MLQNNDFIPGWMPASCSIAAGRSSPARSFSPSSNTGAAMLPHLVRMSMLKHEDASRLEHYPHDLPLAPECASSDDLAAVGAELQELRGTLAETTKRHEEAAQEAAEAVTKLQEQLQAAEEKSAQLHQELLQAQGALQTQEQASRQSQEVKSSTDILHCLAGIGCRTRTAAIVIHETTSSILTA